MPSEWKVRFWTKAARSAEPSLGRDSKPLTQNCLIWEASVDNTGYGTYRVPPNSENLKPMVWRSHRLSFALTRGPFPSNAQIDHICRNRRCIEPTHLELVGISEHAQRSNEDRYRGTERKVQVNIRMPYSDRLRLKHHSDRLGISRYSLLTKLVTNGLDRLDAKAKVDSKKSTETKENSQ